MTALLHECCSTEDGALLASLEQFFIIFIKFYHDDLFLQIQMLLSFKGMLPCLSLQHHQPSLLFVNFKHQSVPVSGQLATSTTFIPCKTKDSVLRVALLQCKQKQGVCIAARRWH